MTIALLTTAVASPRQRVGLVLSGGGAKGVAHVGVIRALEANGIPIDCIAGTSMGAIVGGLYAIGYSPDEMMQLMTSPTFLHSSMGNLDPEESYLFFKPATSPTMFTINGSVADSLHISPMLPASLISPMPMNFDFMAIFSAYTGQCGGQFDRLFVPFRCVASDITRKRKVVFGAGSLGKAIRASMSFPIVFKPEIIDGNMLCDGGIYENFPVATMRDEFAPDIIIGVDVHSTDSIKGFPDIMSQLDMLVVQNNNYDLPPDQGIKLRINLDKYSLLDFDKAQEIADEGYKTAIAMIDSIKRRIGSRAEPTTVAQRREQFKRETPPVVFDSVAVRGGTERQRRYVAALFRPQHADTFGLAFAREAYAKAVSTRLLNDLDPTARYDSLTRRFCLDATIDVKANLSVGLGGYLTSSTNSMLFISGNYADLSFRSIDASLAGWIGQSYMAATLSSRYVLPWRRPSAIAFEATAWRRRFNEDDKLFYQDRSPAGITQTEYFARLRYSTATDRHSVLDIGAGYCRDGIHYLVDGSNRRNKLSANLWQAIALWRYTTLDASWLPTSGQRIELSLQGVSGATRFRPIDSANQRNNSWWAQFEARYANYFGLSQRLTLGVESTLLYSTRPLVGDYDAAIAIAPAFNPTAASFNTFNRDFRANQFATVGGVASLSLSQRVALRSSLYLFAPLRTIEAGDDGRANYGRWLGSSAFWGETALVIKFPFANLMLYGDYHTSAGNNWSFGIAFGLFNLASSMLQL